MNPLRIPACLLLACLGLLALAPAAVAANGDKVLADWRTDGSIDGTYTMADLRAADRQINAQEREYTFWEEAYADAVRRLNNPDAPRSNRPPTVPPQDFDRDGDIDQSDFAVAARKTTALRKERDLAANGSDGDEPFGEVDGCFTDASVATAGADLDVPDVIRSADDVDSVFSPASPVVVTELPASDDDAFAAAAMLDANSVLDDPCAAEGEDVVDEAIAAPAKGSGGGDGTGVPWLAALLLLVPAAIIGGGAWRMQRTRDASRRTRRYRREAATSSFARGTE